MSHLLVTSDNTVSVSVWHGTAMHSTGRNLILIYVVEKRKGELLENPSAKTKRVEKNRCSDLVVLGLPWKCTEDDLRKHFSQFGELLMVQVCELSFDFTLLRGSVVQCISKCLTNHG